MSLRFAIFLSVLGAAALVAMAWPGVVLIGLLMGVVPGLLLWVAPTLFVYSLLWWTVRAILRAIFVRIPILAQTSGRPRLRLVVPVLSVAIVAAPALLVPHRINARIEETAQSLRADDIEPPTPTALPGVVALVIDGNINWSKRKPYCETLCLRLLFNAAVERVIAIDPAHRNAATAYWIERRENCPAQANFRSNVRWAGDFPLKRGDQPEDRVSARIAAGECLMEADGDPATAAATISFLTVQKGASIFAHPWWLDPGPLAAKRLEVTDASGATLYRRTEVTMVSLTKPLEITTAAGLLTTVTYAGWARAENIVGEIGPEGRDVLPQVLGEAVRKPELRAQLSQ